VPAIETLIIGAGQAGLALSHHLSAAGADHVVLERGRIGERWRSERWPSLHLLTPNWLNRLPGVDPPADPDGFQPVADFADSLGDYARSFDAPVLERCEVWDVARLGGGYRVHAGEEVWAARDVVIATGDCDRPSIPRVAAAVPAWLEQLHASAYRTPDGLPPGAVLVVGAGASGQLLAAELRRAGRRVVLAAGGHSRLPRRYRGRDCFEWLSALGRLDDRIEDVPDPVAARSARSPALSGSRGGEPLDLAVLQAAGVELAGRLVGFDGGHARFAGDLADSTAAADARLRRLLDRIDAHIGTSGPAFPAPVRCEAAPERVSLRGFSTIVWATGYRRAYPWLRVPALDARGELIHDRGAVAAPGLHVLGLRFQQHRMSHFIGGVGRDAGQLADRFLRREYRCAA
jgi:putative flavoprotein involved in K+ transport